MVQNYTGAEIVMLFKEAGLIALLQDLDIQKFTIDFINQAMLKVKPRTNQAMLTQYVEFRNNVGFAN